jgi:hypothetical protein
MLAECGHCGWTQEVDGEPQAIAEYARHMIQEHPDEATSDSVVRMWLALREAHVAKTNGRPY